MQLSRTSRRQIGVGGLLALTAIVIFWPFCFFYDSVCSQCGAIQHTTMWQLPHGQHSFFSGVPESMRLRCQATSLRLVPWPHTSTNGCLVTEEATAFFVLSGLATVFGQPLRRQKLRACFP